jgi:inorganic pyrophosphatase/exopolyphosphatase
VISEMDTIGLVDMSDFHAIPDMIMETQVVEIIDHRQYTDFS